jgi:hypothetical protein
MTVKKIVAALALAGLITTATGCTTSTSYGECKGFANMDERDAKLKYEVSTGNIVWSVIFSETLLWPGLTAAFWIWCPTGSAPVAAAGK